MAKRYTTESGEQIDQLAALHGLTEEVVIDNGFEFASKAMFLWSLKTGVKLRFIQLGGYKIIDILGLS